MERKGLYTQGASGVYRCVKADLTLHVDFCGIPGRGRSAVWTQLGQIIMKLIMSYD